MLTIKARLRVSNKDYGAPRVKRQLKTMSLKQIEDHGTQRTINS